MCSRVLRCYSISPKFVCGFFAINKDGLRAVGIPARMAENSAGADFKLFEAPSVNQVLSVHPAQHINFIRKCKSLCQAYQIVPSLQLVIHPSHDDLSKKFCRINRVGNPKDELLDDERERERERLQKLVAILQQLLYLVMISWCFHVHPAVRLEHLSGMPNPQTWWAGHCLDSVSGNDRQERSE